MKHQCGIIRDLLPLYHDGVCSAESRGAVDEHLTECNDCSEYYKKLLDERENFVVPEIEEHKADSFRAVQRRIKRSVRAAIFFAAAVLVICLILGMAMIMMSEKSKRIIEYDGSNITVSMKSEGLVATVRGAWYSGSHVKSVFMEDNGRQKLLKIFCLEEPDGWNVFAADKNETHNFTVAYADMDADRVDAVYYYSGALNEGKLKGMEDMPPDELAELLGEMTLLWER